MRITLVPQWIEPLLKQGHLRYSDLGDLNKLLTILSPQDVGLYSMLQQRVGDYLPPGFREADTFCNSYMNELSDGSSLGEYIELNIIPVYKIANVADYLSLCNGNVQYSLTDCPVGIDVEILSEEEMTYYVRIKPLSKRSDLLNTYQQFLSIYSKYRSVEEVAALCLFKAFEVLLSKDVLAA